VARFFARLLARLVYRLRVIGPDHVPATGPVLLLSNHVTYVDWLILMAATPRPVRFVIAENFINNPVFGWVLRMFRAIPLARKGGPKSLTRTFDAIKDALAKGECVCMFPEGYPTRSGTMLPFKRGFERIAKSVQAIVVPVYLDELWGSIFSYRHGKMFWKWPERRRYPVRCVFGKPVPNDTQTAQVRQVIQEMAAEMAKERTRESLSPHRQFIRMATRHPFRECVVDVISEKPRTLSFGKTLAGAHCLARWLKPKLGDAPMVGVWLPPSLGGALANIALGLLGKTAVNLNYSAGKEAIASAAQQCGLRHVLTSRKFLTRSKLELEGVTLLHAEDAVAQISDLQKAVALLWIILLPGWLLERLWMADGLKGTAPTDVCTVIFSSGSTGEPKGVMLTNQNIASNVEAFMEFADFSHRDRVLGVLPFFHSFGYTVTMWGPLMAGASVVYYPDPRAAKEIGDLCQKYKCTLMGATATFLRMYLRRCDLNNFKSMRLLVCGAEKLPPALIEDFRGKFGVMPLEGYGCTELSPVVSANMPEKFVNGVRQVRTKIGTVGQPLPGVAIRVVDPETEKPRPFGEDGEGLVMVSGPNVMKGYLGREDLTRKKVRNGWYDTGDLGWLDEEGFLTLTGRLEQFAKIGGEMVPLEKIDEVLHQILGTTDRVVALSPAPDPKRGERIVVLHKPLADGMTMETLLKKVSESGLPNLWIPDRRDCFEVADFPVLGSGKLDLRRLKDMAVEHVNQRGGQK
jgi:acyl-[acyl-carrier-protein]-phospholipid O-acyltransferase/long-chain-fatty-acid--[acyl-carrier-protein] ligase